MELSHDHLAVRPRESGDPEHHVEESMQVALGSRLRGNERSLWLALRTTSTRLLAAAAFLMMSAAAPAQAPEPLRPYTVVGNAIPAPLTSMRGDAARGRTIVGNRQVG